MVKLSTNKPRNVDKESKQLIKEIKALPPGKEALERLAYLRKAYDWAIEGYRNSLKILSDTTYQDRKHFLLELVQNADDASFSSSDAELTFIIRSDSLELRYNETGFTVDNVIAITGTGSSTKRNQTRLAHSFIGEKGIGFKSVFALAAQVEIESTPWHFSLHKEACIVPHLLTKGLLGQGEGTRLVVTFTDPEVVELVAKELDNYVNGQVESFLFLQKLVFLRVEDHRVSPTQVRSLQIEPANRQGNICELSTQPSNRLRSYTLYTEEVEFPAELVAERWEHFGTDGKSLKRKFTAAALQNTGGTVKNIGRLYCFLPTEVRLPIPIFLQVDGHTKADRERLHDPDQNRWNRYLLIQLPNFLTEAILAWRYDTFLSQSLMDYIPVNPGNDQLSPVFEELILKLQRVSWVLTFVPNEWVEPHKAIRAGSFWTKWFITYPAFRKRAETVIGKKFVNPEWAKDKSRIELWDKYGIPLLSDEQKADILCQANPPKPMLYEDQSLADLYSEIHTFSGLSRGRLDKKVLNKLLLAPIFPLKNKKFGPLHATSQDKVFWIAGRSRRVTGLEGAVDYRIVYTEYTYRPEAGEDATPEKILEIKRINERNHIVRQLLTNLGIPELNDETLLTKLQIPWLTELRHQQDTDFEQSFQVLSAMFMAYRKKRTPEKAYLRNFSVVGEAFFPSTEGVAVNLKNLLLPRELRLSAIDRIYDTNENPVLALPPDLLIPQISEAKQTNWEKETERRQKLIQDWRQFLIYCGIKGKPRFNLKTVKYESAWGFRDNDPARCQLWKSQIDNDYTASNNVEVISVLLDQGTRNVLAKGDYDHVVMARSLYEAWKEDFASMQVSSDNSYQNLYYRHDPPVGYFKTRYLRRDNRSPVVKDYQWGGVTFECIPMESASGTSINAKEALRLNPHRLSEVSITAKYLSIVVESSVEGFGYSSLYLDSLKVPTVKMSDVNSLWSTLDKAQYPEILTIAVELKKLDHSESGLLIYDLENEKLRPATEFRLGKKGAKGVPLLENQYGAIGRTLGELLRLPEENDGTSYLELFKQMVEDKLSWGSGQQQELLHLLKLWQSFETSVRAQISAAFQQTWCSAGFDSAPVLIINDQALTKSFKKASIRAFNLTVNESENYVLEKAAKEFGFIFPQEFGILGITEEKVLDPSERLLFKQYVTGYFDLLEPRERYRLTSIMVHFGTPETWALKIVKADEVYRIIHGANNLRVDLALPYLENGRFIASSGKKPKAILAELLSISEFATYRNALRDLNDVKLPNPLIGVKTSFGGNNDSSLGNQAEAGEKFNDKGLQEDVDVDEKCAEQTLSQSATEVSRKIWGGLQAGGQTSPTESFAAHWKLGVSPEQEDDIRVNLKNEIVAALEAGPKVYFKRLKQNDRINLQDKSVTDEVGSIDSSMLERIVVDEGSGNPKAFLFAEYDGRCQVCGTELKLSIGKKWIDVFHIEELREGCWWGNRPFNILGLCPNCHALAKHGGGLNLTNIYIAAKALQTGDEFPVEVPMFHGDFYVVPVVIAGIDQRLVLSKIHLSHFSALLKAADEAVNQ